MQALEGLRVIDMATVLAGPGAARYLADFGADVVKVESPEGDGLRDLGWRDPSDAMWVAVSTSTESVARRVLALIGVGGDERFGTFAGRMKHRDELEGALAGWIAARPSGDVLAVRGRARGGGARVHDGRPRPRPARASAGRAGDVDGVVMPGPVARLSRTPGRITGPGRPLGADTDEVLSETARPEEVE